ncbi:hypothetical protein FRB90_009392 [Tulasnella sp. 427]|nr:hypothetical protein FRB90_009392 [Tulasnella sp. 427]
MAVQQRARAEGKSRDNEWIVDLVAACLTGDALRWYVDLEESVQNDWKLLRKAMLRQYPRMPARRGASTSTSTSAPTVPTPALAEAPPSPLSVIGATSSTVAVYRIRAYFNDGSSAYLLSGNPWRTVWLTQDTAEALTVDWTPESELEIIQTDTRTGKKLGLVWNFQPEDLFLAEDPTDCGVIFLSSPRGGLPPVYPAGLQQKTWAATSDAWLTPVSEDRTFQDNIRFAAGSTFDLSYTQSEA